MGGTFLFSSLGRTKGLFATATDIQKKLGLLPPLCMPNKWTFPGSLAGICRLQVSREWFHRDTWMTAVSIKSHFSNLWHFRKITFFKAPSHLYYVNKCLRFHLKPLFFNRIFYIQSILIWCVFCFLTKGMPSFLVHEEVIWRRQRKLYLNHP